MRWTGSSSTFPNARPDIALPGFAEARGRFRPSPCRLFFIKEEEIAGLGTLARIEGKKRASPVGQDERGQEGASRQEREETPAASIGTRQENLLQTVTRYQEGTNIFPFNVEMKIRWFAKLRYR